MYCWHCVCVFNNTDVLPFSIIQVSAAFAAPSCCSESDCPRYSSHPRLSGPPQDVNCGCKTVDNMALLVIYCLVGTVACKTTKAGDPALRNKATRSLLPLFDFRSISYIIVCSDSNVGNLRSGHCTLSAVTTEA